MRAYDIALFIVVFHVVLTLLAQTGLFSSSVSIQADSPYLEFINQTKENTTYEHPPSVPDFATATVNILFGIANAVVLFTASVGLVPFTMMDLGVPVEIAIQLQILIWFVYMIGIAQFWSGRSTKGAE